MVKWHLLPFKEGQFRKIKVKVYLFDKLGIAGKQYHSTISASRDGLIFASHIGISREG